MIAALATVLFLTTLWFLGALALATVEKDGAKVLAALKGQSPLATAPIVRPTNRKVELRARATRQMRARPTLRVAA